MSLVSTQGIVLHTTPYGESAVVAKVFTRQLGLRSYIIKGVRGGGNHARVRQKMLDPLTCLDMVVYDSHRSQLNYVKELSPRHPALQSDPVGNALRFFMTEVLYKVLKEEEPMPELFDYVERSAADGGQDEAAADAPILFLLRVALHMGIMPLDNHSATEPYFDLEGGRYVPSPTETTLPARLSELLAAYIGGTASEVPFGDRRNLIDSLLAYYQMHLTGFRNFRSHEILHTILR